MKAISISTALTDEMPSDRNLSQRLIREPRECGWTQIEICLSTLFTCIDNSDFNALAP